MCLTLQAYTSFCEEYGSLQSFIAMADECVGEMEENEETGEIKVITPPDNCGLISLYIWALDTLLKGGHATACLQNSETSIPVPPTQEQLMDLFGPGDVVYIQRKVMDAINAGQSREVGVDSPKKENGVEKPAPVS